jgi:hypothetical protein
VPQKAKNEQSVKTAEINQNKPNAAKADAKNAPVSQANVEPEVMQKPQEFILYLSLPKTQEKSAPDENTIANQDSAVPNAKSEETMPQKQEKSLTKQEGVKS